MPGSVDGGTSRSSVHASANAREAGHANASKAARKTGSKEPKSSIDTINSIVREAHGIIDRQKLFGWINPEVRLRIDELGVAAKDALIRSARLEKAQAATDAKAGQAKATGPQEATDDSPKAAAPEKTTDASPKAAATAITKEEHEAALSAVRDEGRSEVATQFAALQAAAKDPPASTNPEPKENKLKGWHLVASAAGTSLLAAGLIFWMMEAQKKKSMATITTLKKQNQQLQQAQSAADTSLTGSGGDASNLGLS